MELKGTAFGTATLGSVIEALKQCDQDEDVRFDFCYLRPTTVHSYRGHYDHLALGWSAESASPKEHWPKVSAVLAELQKAVGSTFEGYKGGQYVMGLSTPIWVDNRHDASGTAIVSVDADSGYVVLRTERVD